ncbi:MAG: hypothetical protein U1F33_12680 [Alphaproteobacteria bacterium]
MASTSAARPETLSVRKEDARKQSAAMTVDRSFEAVTLSVKPPAPPQHEAVAAQNAAAFPFGANGKVAPAEANAESTSVGEDNSAEGSTLASRPSGDISGGAALAWLLGMGGLMGLLMGSVKFPRLRWAIGNSAFARALSAPGRSKSVGLLARTARAPDQLPAPERKAIAALAPPSRVAETAAGGTEGLLPIPWSTNCHAEINTLHSQLRLTNLELLAFLTSSLDRLIPHVTRHEEGMSEEDIENLQALQREISAHRSVITAQLDELETSRPASPGRSGVAA